jgi:hypothetical protein
LAKNPEPSEKELTLHIHAASTWCEFGEGATAMHCDGTCRDIASHVWPLVKEWLRVDGKEG